MKHFEDFITFTQITALVFYTTLCIKSRGNKHRFFPLKEIVIIQELSNVIMEFYMV
jgi:hypothetical protein